MVAVLVRDTVGTTATAATTQVASFTASAAGNLLVAIFSNAGGTANTISGVTDSSSTAWTLATRGGVSGGTNTRTAMYYRANCPAGITSATVTQGSAVGHWMVMEFSGVATASTADTMSPVDSSAAAGTTITTPSIVTTATDLVIAFWHSSTTTATAPGSPWNALTDATDAAAMTKAAYQVGAAAGTYAGTWTSLGASKTPGTGTASFKEAAAAAAGRVQHIGKWR